MPRHRNAAPTSPRFADPGANRRGPGRVPNWPTASNTLWPKGVWRKSRGLRRRATASALLLVVLAGCTRDAEAPHPQRERPVAPIAALQVGDLLSDKVQDKDGNLFIAVEPKECSGMALEVDPP